MTNTSGQAFAHEIRGEDTAPQPAPSLTVRSTCGVEGLMALQTHWNEIAAIRADLRFHHLHAWHLSYLRNLEQDAMSVHFFSFFRGQRPLAIVPLRRVRRSLNGIPLWLWELPFHPHMDLCDCLIADPADAATVLRLLLKTLRSRGGQPWDALHLPRLLDDTPVLAALRADPAARTCVIRNGQSMYFCCADMASAMRNNSGQFKRNLRRQHKKLERLGHVEVALVQDGNALEEAFSAFLRIEASGWKGEPGRGSAIVLRPQLVRFYRELMERFSADGRCQINLLKLDGTVIAAQFCLLVGGTLYLLKIAYDEAYRAEAPGNQLLHAVLEHCCRSPAIAHLSLVTGPPWTAKRWNPLAQDVWSAYLFNTSLRGMAAYAAARLRAALAGAAGRNVTDPAEIEVCREAY